MSGRGYTVAWLVFTFPHVCAHAEDPAQKQMAVESSDAIEKTLGPFKFHAGPTDNGTFGAGIDGDGRKALCISECFGVQSKPPPENVSRFWYPAFGNVGYAISGAWSNDSNRPNNASISLKPGIDGGLYFGQLVIPVEDPTKPAAGPCNASGHCSTPLATLPRFLFAVGAYGDIEFRDGTFQSGSNVSKARQFLGGGGIYLGLPLPDRWDWVDVHPRLSATYYAPFATHQIGDSSTVLPEGVKEKFIQSEFHTALLFGPQSWMDGKRYPFKFDLIYDGSKATSGSDKAWKSLWKLRVSTGLLGHSQITPVISYQSGTDGTFQYDRQWLLGALWEFLEPGKK